MAHDPDFYKKIGARGGRNGYVVRPVGVNSMKVDINPAYTVLSDGTVLGTDGNAKKPQLDRKGYLRVQIYLSGRKVVTEKVHRLVARHFIPNPHKLPQVNHIDGDKTNNDVSNLEWVSGAENMEHAVEHDLFEHNRNKEAERLAPQVLTAIEQRYLMNDICRLNGISRNTVRRYMAKLKEGEPITDLKVGRRMQLYYFDKSRNKYRVVKKDTGIETAQFDTEAEALRYIDSQTHAGGFHVNPELARVAGALGGAISRRGKYKLNEQERREVRKAYEELMKIHRKAQREREREAAYNVA